MNGQPVINVKATLRDQSTRMYDVALALPMHIVPTTPTTPKMWEGPEKGEIDAALAEAAAGLKLEGWDVLELEISL